MSAYVAHMSKAALAADEELAEGEYDTQFGKVIVEKTDNGYRIVIYINGKKLGQQMAKQIAYSFLSPNMAKGGVT